MPHAAMSSYPHLERLDWWHQKHLIPPLFGNGLRPKDLKPHPEWCGLSMPFFEWISPTGEIAPPHDNTCKQIYISLTSIRIYRNWDVLSFQGFQTITGVELSENCLLHPDACHQQQFRLGQRQTLQLQGVDYTSSRLKGWDILGVSKGKGPSEMNGNMDKHDACQSFGC